MDLVNAQKIYSGIIMGCNCATDKAIKELYAKKGECSRQVLAQGEILYKKHTCRNLYDSNLGLSIPVCILQGDS